LNKKKGSGGGEYSTRLYEAERDFSLRGGGRRAQNWPAEILGPTQTKTWKSQCENAEGGGLGRLAKGGMVDVKILQSGRQDQKKERGMKIAGRNKEEFG